MNCHTFFYGICSSVQQLPLHILYADLSDVRFNYLVLSVTFPFQLLVYETFSKNVVSSVG